MLVFGQRYVEANLKKAFDEGADGSALCVLGEGTHRDAGVPLSRAS